MIKVDAVTFAYRDAIVFNGSFTLEENSFTGIIGPNGGGKTTFLKLLMGLLRPKSGKITIDERPPSKMRTRIGYVPQMRQFDRDFPITVRELVLMGRLNELNVWGRYPKEALEAADLALQQVGLSDLSERSFGSLSGGQQQRTLIARALCSQPQILLLDEPTASVDPAAQEVIHQILLSLKGQVTLLMVTHELPGLIKEVDQVLCINRTPQILDPAKVCGHYAMGLYHPHGDGK